MLVNLALVFAATRRSTPTRELVKSILETLIALALPSHSSIAYQKTQRITKLGSTLLSTVEPEQGGRFPLLEMSVKDYLPRVMAGLASSASVVSHTEALEDQHRLGIIMAMIGEAFVKARMIEVEVGAGNNSNCRGLIAELKKNDQLARLFPKLNELE